MTRLLGRIPAWLWTAVEVAGIGVLVVLNGLGKSWTGKAGVIALIFTAFVTLVSAVASRLQKWFSNRLQVRINLDAPDQPLLADTLSDTLIDEWLEQQRDSCLKPLREAQEKAEQQRQRELERRFQVNNPLVEGVTIPEGIILALQREFSLATEIARASGYRPESREPDEYARQVDEYLDKARTVLTNRLTRSYAQSQRGLLLLRPVNKTDRTFKEVKFLLRLPQGAKAIDPRKIEEHNPLPKPPRPYGTKEFTTPLLSSAITFPPRAGRPELANLGPGVSIEDTPLGSVVTYSPVTLRAKDHETVLPDVRLYLSRDVVPGPLILEWEATADNAEGRVSGQFEVTIGSAPLPAADLLRDVLPEVEGTSPESDSTK